MALFSQRSDVDSDYVFVSRLRNVKNIFQILKAINFKDHAIFYCTEDGWKITVEDVKCVQASAFIQSEIFQEYHLKKTEDIVAFSVNLSVVLECLNIFGNSSNTGVQTALKMCYSGYGFPLKLLLEEDGVITDCTVRTQVAEEALDFNFDNATVVNKVILRCDFFKEVMNDLDLSSELIEILLSPDPPYFRFTTVGDAGESQTEIPKDSEMIESFQCSSVIKASFKLSHVKPSVKPLAVSHKVSVRMDDRGLLCFQYMIKLEDSQTCFVEYFCMPVIDDDDINDDT